MVDGKIFIRVLIVDDEPIARRGLRKLLRGRSGVEVVGECADGREAVAAIERLRPDLVLLDVQMPEVGGFDVIDRVGLESMPPVLFVTAYDTHAIRAFEVQAVDYVLKPVDPVRFQQAFDKATARIDRQAVRALSSRIDEVVRRLDGIGGRGDRYTKRLTVKEGGRAFFLDIDQVDWIEAAGNYVRLHARDRSHLRRDTMIGLLSRLDPDSFVRIGRSAIVNVDSILDLEPLFKGSYVVRLKDGTELTSSRRYHDHIRVLLDSR